MKRYCFALDLKDDPALISEYIEYHKKVWPEILKSIKDSGIIYAEIYHVFDRLFLIIDTHESFSLENKGKMDSENPIVQKWEDLMWNYQKALPNAKPGEKWILMERIFKL
ncbi:L-rhamnose mutarotase [Flavivirga aquimarina]|uniref:L-rhamnose mutarotase n=1 Tax=Flavivirga aquimarina TaxID=2027862 RepID=A0ABT8W752_9FLAO|nr:L-rhamnose mutarotase [Flavivirga aquimarina]MDO5968926.1 L-rhamnose mutarotase [Flavivirga aquimarina]